MKRLARWLMWLVAIGAALLVGVGVGLMLWFDAGRAGDRIEAFLAARLGQPVSLQRVSLNWTPLPGVRVDGLSVGDPAMPLARVASLLLQVRLAPLLERRLHLATVTVDGLALRLAAGAGPVVALPPGEPDSPASGPAAGTSSTSPIRVDELRIRNSSVRLTGDPPLALEAISLSAGPLALGEPVTVALEAVLESALSGPLRLDGTLTISDAGDLRLTDTQLTLGAGQSLPAPLSLNLELLSEPAAKQLSVPSFSLSGLGAQIDGELQITDLGGTPQFQGGFNTVAFPARELLAALDMPVPVEPTALSRVQLTASLSGDATALRLEPRLQVDDSTLTGNLVFSPGSSLALDLEVDQLDLDRYATAETGPVSPASPGGAVAAAAASAGDSALPMDLRLSGELRVATLRVANARLDALRLPLKLADGILELQPSARLYGGEYRGDIRLDGRASPPRLSLDEHLRDVQAGPLLAALVGEARISGRTDLDARLSLLAGDEDTLRRSLDGELRLVFREGVYQGVNLPQLLRNAQAILAGRPPPVEQAVPGTDFSELSGSFRFAGGRLLNDDLQAKSPFLRVQGQGSAELLSEALDYRLTVVLVDTPEGQGGAGLADLEGLPVPVRVTGKLGEPRFQLDAETLLREHGEAILEDKLGDLGEQVGDELRNRLGQDLDKQLGDQLEKEAGKLLKGLFR